MTVRKHPVEQYKHYTIYVVSGIKPELWLAEKENPAKGPTLTANSLKELKTSIDKALDYMVSIKINIDEGLEINKVFQKNPSVKINANGLTYESIVIIVTGSYDLDAVIEFSNNCPMRRSKKHRKTRKYSGINIKLICRNCTVYQR